eukprot:4234980-Pyramimonas_sp.AAC.1
MMYHHNAAFGREPAMLPDLPVLDQERQTERSDRAREQIICRGSTEAITQAIAIQGQALHYGPRRPSLVSITTTKGILLITSAPQPRKTTGVAGVGLS